MHRILSLHILTPSYEVIPAKFLRAPVKNYGKGADSKLPVFTVKSTEIILQCLYMRRTLMPK